MRRELEAILARPQRTIDTLCSSLLLYALNYGKLNEGPCLIYLNVNRISEALSYECN